LDATPESTHQPQPSNGIHEDPHNIYELKERDYKDDPVYMDTVERSSFEAAAAEQHSFHNHSFDKTNEISMEPEHPHSTSFPAAVNGGSLTSEVSQSGVAKKKRRFGIFPAAMGVFVLGGALAANFLGKDSEQKPSDPPTPSPLSSAAKMKSPPVAIVPEHKETRSMDKAGRSAFEIAPASPTDSRIPATSEQVVSSSQASPMAWESYEIIQPTRVFSAPSEHSQLVANVEPGTQVNVVNSRNGWLEIRSKHGRPPGFIQKTAAVRIGQN
jgi:Bacterial SH3 domain